jgi:chemotaxis protein methyltransferase CheR
VRAIEFGYLQGLMKERSGVVLEAGKEYLVESRLTPLIEEEGLASLEELLEKLRSDRLDALRGRVVDAMITKETSFFREFLSFELLRKKVLPELIESRSAERSLSVWCAACSSGQEPYSVAMLLRSEFARVASWDVTILASDLSTSILEKARSGLFSQIEVNRGLPAQYLVRFFHRRGVDWRIDASIREMVDFTQMNLAGPWPAMPSMDLILMRNVLIYFDRPTQRSVLARIGRTLRPDGWLLLGGAEASLGLEGGFDRIEMDRAVIHRQRAT